MLLLPAGKLSWRLMIWDVLCCASWQVGSPALSCLPGFLGACILHCPDLPSCFSALRCTACRGSTPPTMTLPHLTGACGSGRPCCRGQTACFTSPSRQTSSPRGQAPPPVPPPVSEWRGGGGWERGDCEWTSLFQCRFKDAEPPPANSLALSCPAHVPRAPLASPARPPLLPHPPPFLLAGAGGRA